MKFGYDGALVLNFIGYWTLLNEKNKKNFRDGYYWVYISIADLLKEFPFTTVGKLRGALRKLYEARVLIIDCFNRHGSDKTKWYRLNENDNLAMKYLMLIRERIERKRGIKSLCKNNKSICKNNKPICKIYKPLPTVITEVITDVGAPPRELPKKRKPKRVSYNTVDLVAKEVNSYAD